MMFWDCKARNATVADATTHMPAMPAMPEGMPNCNKCFMVGSEMGCEHCHDGFYLDYMTGTCMKHEEKNHTADDGHKVKTNVVPCTQPELMASCKICSSGKYDVAGNMQEIQSCLLCNTGFVKGDKGGCYDMANPSGQDCSHKPHGCE
jgi:hypothetical protein